MTDPPAAPRKRPTPWSVLVVAGLVFALCVWLFLGVREEARQNEAARRGARSAAPVDRPKLLGRDIIPQEGVGVAPGSGRPDAPPAPSASSAAGAPAAPSTSAAPAATSASAASGGPPPAAPSAAPPAAPPSASGAR